MKSFLEKVIKGISEKALLKENYEFQTKQGNLYYYKKEGMALFLEKKEDKYYLVNIPEKYQNTLEYYKMITNS